MKATTWCGRQKIRVEEVADPKILNPHDAIVRVTLTAICGSDLHLYDGFIPSMEAGDVLGHEFMGEVVETGREVRQLFAGDRVVVAFPISCGRCWYCKQELYSLCDNTNPNAWMMEKQYGQTCAGIYGYSHLLGGYAGGQAQYVRVPFADVGALKVPDSVIDEKVLFLSDILPTGYQAADHCSIKPGDTIAVWGCGPVGQFAILSAYLLGAERVIAVDHVKERLELAERCGAEPVNFDDEYIQEKLLDMTGGRGPDACIEAVGLEAHGMALDAVYDKVKTATMMVTDRGHVLRQMIYACRKGGAISIAGVYGGFVDKIPMGAAFNKSLQFRMGQTHVQRYMPRLLDHIIRGDIDPSYIISHRFALSDAPDAYAIFHAKQDKCIKVVMRP